jgi:hypothetical protein
MAAPEASACGRPNEGPFALTGVNRAGNFVPLRETAFHGLGFQAPVLCTTAEEKYEAAQDPTTIPAITEKTKGFLQRKCTWRARWKQKNSYFQVSLHTPLASASENEGREIG